MTRIAIITEDDDIWALYAWSRAIPVLQLEGYEIIGIWACPSVLSGMRGSKIYLWYLKRFGIYNFVKLALFAVIIKLGRLTKRIVTKDILNIRDLAKNFGIPFEYCSSPNSPCFIRQIKSRRTDIMLIMVSFILKSEALSSVNFAVINKHAAALPVNRGLFPYIWATINQDQQGVSYHKTIAGIDDGPILYQDLSIPKSALSSMVAYYFYVFQSFPHGILRAIKMCLEEKEAPPSPEILKSYHGLPGAEDMRLFFSKGGKIIKLRDFLLTLRMIG